MAINTEYQHTKVEILDVYILPLHIPSGFFRPAADRIELHRILKETVSEKTPIFGQLLEGC